MNEGTGPRLADALILAMREPYLSKLLSGEKTVEVRKTRPHRPDVCGMVLYLYHKRHIYGHVTVRQFQNTKYRLIDDLCEEMHEKACLTHQAMRKYLYGYRSNAGFDIACRNGILYIVEKPVRYARPVPVPCRPQSWQYMTDDVRGLLPIDGKEETQ